MEFDHKITLEEIQRLEYELLKAFDQLAKDNDIKYSLCGGTALGAVRHNGFIPWDDDTDICLLRKDYDKLIEVVRNERCMKDHPNFRFCLPLDDNYIYPFIKLVDDNTVVYEKDINKKYSLGVWLDIFPMDSWPDDKGEIRKLIKKFNKYKFFNKISVAGDLTSLPKKILACVGKFGSAILHPRKNYKYWNKKMMDLIQPCQGHYIGNRAWTVGEKDLFDANLLDELVLCKFVDQEFPIPKDYDQYLTNMYGDYMQIPKEEDRIIHDFEGYVLKKK